MIEDFFREVENAIDRINYLDVEKVATIVKNASRLFIIGSGGGAGNASHACADFRKLCNIEAYAPYDNISELTARTNDEGYKTSISEWLKVSNLNKNDCLFVLSVGGGAEGVSENINMAIKEAKDRGASIVGIVGRDGGNTKKHANACILIETPNYVTPIVEGLQSVICHLLVTILQVKKPVW
jgi:D-sedoheptulose 7-phosphate isomerase